MLCGLKASGAVLERMVFQDFQVGKASVVIPACLVVMVRISLFCLFFTGNCRFSVQQTRY